MNRGTGLLIKPGIFLSSYAPLFAMLAIRFDDARLRWVCIVLATAGLVIVVLCIVGVPRLIGASVYRIDRVSPAGAEAAGYLASYLLPFLTVALPTSRDLWAYGVFLIIAGIVYTRTAVIQVNPMLLILGWQILRIENSEGLNAYLVSRRSVVAGDRVRGVRLASDVIIDRTPAR